MSTTSASIHLDTADQPEHTILTPRTSTGARAFDPFATVKIDAAAIIYARKPAALLALASALTDAAHALSAALEAGE